MPPTAPLPRCCCRLLDERLHAVDPPRHLRRRRLARAGHVAVARHDGDGHPGGELSWWGVVEGPRPVPPPCAVLLRDPPPAVGPRAVAFDLGLHIHRRLLRAPRRGIRKVPRQRRGVGPQVHVSLACWKRMLTRRTAMCDLAYRLFCLATFALNFGPNVSTYVLPASSFPQQASGDALVFSSRLVPSNSHSCRLSRSAARSMASLLRPGRWVARVTVLRTVRVLSDPRFPASSGSQAGAVFGTFVYPILQTHLGLASIMWMQVAVSLLGAIISVVFLRPYYPPGVSPAPRGTARAWLECKWNAMRGSYHVTFHRAATSSILFWCADFSLSWH